MSLALSLLAIQVTLFLYQLVCVYKSFKGTASQFEDAAAVGMCIPIFLIMAIIMVIS